MKKILSFSFLLIITSSIYSQGESLTNQKIWYSPEFRSDYVSGVRSMNDGEHFTSLKSNENGNSIQKFTYKNYEKIATIVSSKDIKNKKGENIKIEEYDFNKAETKILIATAVEPIYRHSYKAYFYIYDIESKSITPLSNPEKGKQRLAEFSPDGNKVAFVRDNNIFVKNLETNDETKATEDGKINHIINGAVDWVYEEEFSFHKGFFWNSNSSQIAYYKLNESKVKEWNMRYYGSLYPHDYHFKYPKAGEENSQISIHIYNVSSHNTLDVNLGEETDIYIPRMQWTNDPFKLTIQRLNRLQNHFELLLINTDPGLLNPVQKFLKTELLYEEKAETYVDIQDNTHYLSDNKYVFTSEKNGYNHIYLRSFYDKNEKQITSGNWDVTEVIGVDEKEGWIYYISAEDGAIERQLYKIRLDGKKKTKLSTKKGQNRADFSKNLKYYINYHSDANTPYYITLHKNDGSLIKELVNNKELKETLSKYDLSSKEFFTFKNDEGIDLNGWMIKPQNFDSKKKYPVLMTVYNGPGINTVNNSWGGSTSLWHHLLTQKGYIVVSVDGRGTGYRGREFKHITYLQLGKYETEDQISAAKYLGSLSYVDEKRIGIQGWSYGGYMASLCMTKGADVFKAGIAVAPVTNWRFYDNIYTERFMRKPQENGDNYDINSPINHVDKLKGAYLLVHGDADDNVHIQNTMEMINALVKANKEFDLFIYPNKNHGIYGGTTRMHLFNKMTTFLEENL